MPNPFKTWWPIVVLAAALAGCASNYADYEDTKNAFDKAAALGKAGNHAAAAKAYEKLTAPWKPYLLETSYLEAWSGAAKSWEAAGDDARALAAYQQQCAAARQHFPQKPGEWPWWIASADLDLARFQLTREPEQARALVAQLLAWGEAMPGPDQQDRSTATLLGKSLQGAAELFEKLGDPQRALRSAVLGLQKDESHAQYAGHYDLPVRLAGQLGQHDLAAELRARQEAVKTVTAMTENGQLPNPPYRKVGGTYESAHYGNAATAVFYAARAQAYRQLGQEMLARASDRDAALYRQWAAEEAQREAAAAAEASAAPSYDSGGGDSMAGAILGGLMQGAGTVMQQQGGYGGTDAAQGLMLQSVGAAVAGDQQTLDRLTAQSLNAAAGQQLAQGNAAGAVAAQLAASAYQPSPAGAAGGPAYGAGSQTAANGCSDQLIYASGQPASFSAAAAQFSAAELQASFAIFQQCMNGGSGECYMFFRNGEPADYPLASLRGVAGDPNDINASTFRCHAAAGFAAAQ